MTCAECRRLRLQCDKQVPCQSCIRRGCKHLCPHGTGITAEGSGVILAATKPLHETVKDLRVRIRALETALNSIHISRTGHTHPLLSTAAFDDDTELHVKNAEDSEEKQNLMQKLALVRGRDGSHRIAAAHEKNWITYSVNEAHIIPSLARDTIEPSRQHHPGVHLRHLLFQLPMPVCSTTMSILQQQIPPQLVLDALIGVFRQSIGSTGLIPAFSEQYIKHILIPRARSQSASLLVPASLASLFSILALGSLFAVEGSEAPEVGHFADLSTEALVVSQAMASPSIELAEALYLRARVELCRQGQLKEQARSMLAMSAQTCLALGLHRDGAYFDLEPNTVDRRRLVFWMIYISEVWESFSVGRPAIFGFSLEFIDTQFPTGSSHSQQASEWLRRYVIVTQVLAAIANMTLTLKAPSYEEVLAIDDRVRKLLDQGWEHDTPGTVAVPALLLIYLHRAFYARTVIQNSEDMSHSDYYYSVHAVLRGARETLTWADVAISRSPAMCARFDWIWSMAVTATMIYSLMLDHAPHCELAPECRQGLDFALRLFELGRQYGSGRAKQALTIFLPKQVPSDTTESSKSAPSAETASAGHISGITAVTSDVKKPIHTMPFAHLMYPGDDVLPTSRIAPMCQGPLEPVYTPTHANAPFHDNPGVRVQYSSEEERSAEAISTDPAFLPTNSQVLHDQDDEIISRADDFAVSLWSGIGWANMDQYPMDLTVPEGHESLGSLALKKSQARLTSLGATEQGLSGSLNGEWFLNYYR